MPVTVIRCPSCKSQLKVPDHMLGQDRAVKCPGCAHIMKLSEVAGIAPAPPKAPAVVTNPAATEEEPYGEFEVLEETAAPVGTPKFEVVEDKEDDGGFEVVDEGRKKKRSRDDDDRPRRKKRRAREDDDDDFLPRKTAARTSRRGVSPMLWVGLGVGGFVLLVAAIVVVVLLVQVTAKPRLTPENMAKIKTGMSQKDVEKILGPGNTQTLNFFGMEQKVITWEDGNTTFQVVLVNDQVVSTQQWTVGRR